MLGSRVLRQAADAYDRAARAPYGRIPPPSPVGNRLRQAARLISAFAYITQDQSMAPLVLITKLAALAEAVAELRESQQHAAQAAAALRAADTSTPPPAQPSLRRPGPPHHSHNQPRSPAAPRSSPPCRSPSQPGPTVGHPHPVSPAPPRQARHHHGDPCHHDHVAQPLRRT